MGGRFRARGATLLVVAAALAVALPGAAAANTPHVDYMLQCQGCHLADGSGSPGSVPSMRGFVGNYLLVPGGREYLVRVPGASTSPLDDARLAAVLNWIVRAFGPAEVAADFTPFSAGEVARHRRPPFTDVEAVRGELLRRIGELDREGRGGTGETPPAYAPERLRSAPGSPKPSGSVGR